MKNLLITLTALTLSSGMAYANQDVKDACASDVATTGCNGEGKEQIKCLHEYKKNNKDFKFSEGCKSSFKEHREEMKEKHAERKAKREEKKAKIQALKEEIKEVKKDTK